MVLYFFTSLGAAISSIAVILTELGGRCRLLVTGPQDGSNSESASTLIYRAGNLHVTFCAEARRIFEEENV